MDTSRSCPHCQQRRDFLHTSLTLGLGLALPSFSQAGIIKLMDGDLSLNGKPVGHHTRLQANSAVKTLDKSSVFSIGQDAFLLRPNSEVQFVANRHRNTVIDGLRLITGGLLSVFGRGEKTLRTSTATIGIRGTGVYLENTEKSSYVCLCYGAVDLSPLQQPKAITPLSATHHAAKTISQDGQMQDDSMKNHTDDELVMLEEIVGRKPPFVS